MCQWHTFSTDRSGAETLRELRSSGAILHLNGDSLKKEELVLDQLSHIVETSALCQMNRDQLSDETFVPFEMNE